MEDLQETLKQVDRSTALTDQQKAELKTALTVIHSIGNPNQNGVEADETGSSD